MLYPAVPCSSSHRWIDRDIGRERELERTKGWEDREGEGGLTCSSINPLIGSPAIKVGTNPLDGPGVVIGSRWPVPHKRVIVAEEIRNLHCVRRLRVLPLRQVRQPGRVPFIDSVLVTRIVQGRRICRDRPQVNGLDRVQRRSSFQMVGIVEVVGPRIFFFGV